MVVLPNMRGHFFSGRRRGDIEYIGQYEDDIVDLIRLPHLTPLAAPLFLEPGIVPVHGKGRDRLAEDAARQARLDVLAASGGFPNPSSTPPP
jgi:hypothetical protein